jgi:transcriptional regulator with XRE-family HTH domain
MRRGTTGAWGAQFDPVEAWIGANVRIHRRRANLTQVQLAELIGLEVKTLQKIETGHGNCTARVLAALSLALSIDPGELFKAAPPVEIKRGRPRKGASP